MDDVLLKYRDRIPSREQKGFQSQFKQRTSYAKLPLYEKRHDTVSNYSKTHLIRPELKHNISGEFSSDIPYWTQKELKIARLRQRGNAEDSGLSVERCETSQKDGLLDSNIARPHTDYTGDARIVVDLLKFHARQDDSCSGIKIHSYIVQQGLLDTNVFVGCALLNMYAKCGALGKAQQLFDELPVQNVVSWNTLIAGYTQHGCFVDAMTCYECMQFRGISPNAVTFTCMLIACGNLKESDKGQDIHALAVKAGLVDNDLVLANAIIDMYVKCGLLAKAQEVLEGLSIRDIVSYTALVVGYAQLGQAKKAFHCFDCMQQEGISPNIVTFVGLVKACGSIKAEHLGQKLHTQFIVSGLLDEDISLGTAVVDMYAKCGSLVEAQDVFNELLVHDVVLWNVLITGYVENDCAEEALYQFNQMQAEGFPPSTITFACILKACGGLGMIGKGQDVHAQIVKVGPPRDQLVIETGLVDMYANCAMLAEAQEIFDKLPVCNVVLWSALMEGYGQQGKVEKVFYLLDQMMREGIKADWVIVTIILNMCSHEGLLDRAQMFLEALYDRVEMLPTLDHYTCMVDLLGRAGHVEQAMSLIEEMGFSAKLTLWHTLLGACRKWEYVKLGKWNFELAIQLDEKDAETYACMCNIYG